MSIVKDLIIKPIASTAANNFIKRYHYSGKVVANSQLHFGVFINNLCEGVLQFGPSMMKAQMLPLVTGTTWNGFLELNRMAFTDRLPKNSESRSIAICLRLIKKNYPHIDWVISYADATACGDGIIYRAVGFDLIGIKPNTQIRIDPLTNIRTHKITAYHNKRANEFKDWEIAKGFQIKYIYFLNKQKKASLTVPVLPYAAIKEAGATMYKGEKK